MKILITNDDGIRADGIISLARALEGIGEIVVVAPEAQQSGVGHSITLHKALRCTEEADFPVKNVRAFSTNGTPTDSVLLGIHAVFGENPDLVLSGINAGPNLGEDVTYSGTVAAAMEGVVAKIPSIAVSMGAFVTDHFDECARFMAGLVAVIHASGLPDDILLNVNYPSVPAGEIEGISITRLGTRWYEDVLHERVDPRGRKYYWITGKKVLRGHEPGTDAFELERNRISITPLTLNMTRLGILEDVASALNGSVSSDALERLKYPIFLNEKK